MPLNLGDLFPNFTVDTTEGRVTFHDYIGDKCVRAARCNRMRTRVWP